MNKSESFNKRSGAFFLFEQIKPMQKNPGAHRCEQYPGCRHGFILQFFV